MTIPRVPREKPPEQAQVAAGEPQANDDRDKNFTELFNKYAQNVQTEYLNAWLRHTQATYDYYHNLQEAAASTVDPEKDKALQQEVKSSAEEHNVLKYSEAVQKYWGHAYDAQLAAQRQIHDAAAGYADTVRGIWENAQKEVLKKNEGLAISLKDSLAKMDHTTLDVPMLASLYVAMSGAAGVKR
jgi:hypothetical protein